MGGCNFISMPIMNSTCGGVCYLLANKTRRDNY